MIVPLEIQQWYSDNKGRFDLLKSKAKPALEHFASSKGYLYSGRTKTLESLVEKIDTGRVASWTHVDDAFAATVVVPTYSHEPTVRDFLRTAFYEDRVEERGRKSKPADQFRFDSTRVYCRLESPALSTVAYDQILFEVQILSVFDYAWQKVTHDLVYKHTTVEWRRVRAAAQMKALVEQLDAIAEHFDSFVLAIAAGEWPETSAQTLIIRHIEALFDRGRLPSELLPAAPSRLADTVVSYLKNDGCRGKDLRARMESSLQMLDEYFDANDAADIPRSLTLAQLLFGIMYRVGALSKDVRQRILLNEAMLSAFPELKGYRHVFVV